MPIAPTNKTAIRQPTIGGITEPQKFVAASVHCSRDSQNFPQEARGLSPGRNAGFRNFLILTQTQPNHAHSFRLRYSEALRTHTSLHFFFSFDVADSAGHDRPETTMSDFQTFFELCAQFPAPAEKKEPFRKKTRTTFSHCHQALNREPPPQKKHFSTSRSRAKIPFSFCRSFCFRQQSPHGPLQRAGLTAGVSG